jgi:hypothetical protein
VTNNVNNNDASTTRRTIGNLFSCSLHRDVHSGVIAAGQTVVGLAREAIQAYELAGTITLAGTVAAFLLL